MDITTEEEIKVIIPVSSKEKWNITIKLSNINIYILYKPDFLYGAKENTSKKTLQSHIDN